MKKPLAILSSLVFLGSCALADFDSNFKNAVKELAGSKPEIVLKKPLKSFDKQQFVVAKLPSGEHFPVIASRDGRYFVPLSQGMKLGQADTELIQSSLEKLYQERKNSDAKLLKPLFESFLASDFIDLKSDKKLPTKIVVTDPECPYCRRHLDRIEEVLEDANIRIIFAPVHGESAFIKSQLALTEASEAKDNASKIAVLRKYYDENVKLTDKQKNTNTTRIHKNTEKIFDSGVIKGVPFVYDVPTQ